MVVKCNRFATAMEVAMPSLTIKNIPPELYERLKLTAEAHRRSINSEVIACIEQAVASQPIDPEAFLQRARQLREKSQAYCLTDEEINIAKRQGRP
jgi:antitoxin FitA